MNDGANLIPRAEVIRPPAPMEWHYGLSGRPPGEIDLRDVWNKLRRHKSLILLFVAIGIAVAMYITSISPPAYQAEASIRVENKPTFLGGTRGLTSANNAADQLSTEREVLHSRALAEDVADSLGLTLTMVVPAKGALTSIVRGVSVEPGAATGTYEFTRRGNSSFVAKFTPDEPSTTSRPLVKQVEIGQQLAANGVAFALKPAAAAYPRLVFSIVSGPAAAEAVRASTTILQPVRDANIIVIRYKGPDREMAEAIPNALARRFISRRQSNQKSESHSAVRFLREQLDSLGPQLAAAEDSLRTFREAQNIVSLGTEASAQVSRQAALQARYEDVQAELAGLTQLLTEVQRQDQQRSAQAPSPYRRLLAYPTLLGNGGAAGLLSSLSSADDQRTTLLLRRTESDPDVLGLTAHIHSIESQIKDLTLTYIHGLAIQRDQLKSEIDKFGIQMQAVPAKEVMYARLDRKPKLLDGIYTLLQSRLKEAQIDEGIEDASVQMLDSALVPINPVSPKPALNLAIGMTIGLVFGLGIAFFRDQMDSSVHTREQLKRVTHVPVLGLIPRIRPVAGSFAGSSISGRLQSGGGRFPAWLTRGGARDPYVAQRSRLLQVGVSGAPRPVGKPGAGLDLRSPVSEAYRGLRTNITFAHSEDPPRALVFTSPMPKDGKTTSAANLAITLTQQGLKILLVDADLRRGMLHSLFRIPKQPGLSNVLVGETDWESALSHVDLWRTGTLDVLSTGTAPMNPAELLGSPAMRNFIASAKETYDMILFDSPPLNLVTDAAVLGTVVNGVVLVARAGKSTDDAMRFGMEQLRQVGATVLGTVLNDIDFNRDVRYYGGYGPYAYAYESRK